MMKRAPRSPPLEEACRLEYELRPKRSFTSGPPRRPTVEGFRDPGLPVPGPDLRTRFQAVSGNRPEDFRDTSTLGCP